MWSNVWFIAKADLKRSKWGVLISTFMYAYFCFFGAFLTNELFETTGNKAGIGFLVDIMFLYSLSTLGFVMSGEYRTYWQNDTFSKKLLYLRSLPISTTELVLARYMHMGINLLFLSVIYFIPFYFISVLGDILTIAQYVSFALLWMSLGACASLVYAYKELSVPGKRYFWFCMASAVAFMLICGLGWYMNFGLVERSVSLVQKYGLLVALGSLIIVAIWGWVWSRLTEKRIRSREFSR